MLSGSHVEHPGKSWEGTDKYPKSSPRGVRRARNWRFAGHFGRVVKALHSKCNGLRPREFESHRCRQESLGLPFCCFFLWNNVCLLLVLQLSFFFVMYNWFSWRHLSIFFHRCSCLAPQWYVTRSSSLHAGVRRQQQGCIGAAIVTHKND